MAKYNKADRPDMSPDEMYEVAGRVFDKTFQDPKLVEKVMASKLTLRFKYYDEERWGPGVVPQITIDFNVAPLTVICGDCDIDPILEMSMEAFTAHLFWMQKLPLMAAITRGQGQGEGAHPPRHAPAADAEAVLRQLPDRAQGDGQGRPAELPARLTRERARGTAAGFSGSARAYCL